MAGWSCGGTEIQKGVNEEKRNEDFAMKPDFYRLIKPKKSFAYRAMILSD